ncbi:MAG TPA: creatininase family protein [Methanomassiliicoccales archaeon]|nr:creatininase family protein [Methanomassiliicoccales archaeon]
MRIEEMTSVEFAKAVKKDPVIILPFGACEAHGPHLPLGTDCFQPEALADEVAERIGALVAPMVRYGNHGSTRNMPGTLGLRPETLKSLVTDLLHSLRRNEVSKVVVLTGHAGGQHMAAMKGACEEVARCSDMRIMFLCDYDIAYRLKGEMVDEGDGHGGNIETSRIMALRPELVKKKRGKGRYVSNEFMVTADPERFFPDGFVGDASKATKERGERINKFVAEELSKLIVSNFGAMK